jgi:hypothetical protein
MIERRAPHDQRIVTVANACVEQGFYEIAADDLEESHRAGHDSEAVEKVFSALETEVSSIMGALLHGSFPLPLEHRYKVSLFAALQLTRGWRFRTQMNELGTFAMRQYVETLPPSRFPRLAAQPWRSVRSGRSCRIPRARTWPRWAAAGDGPSIRGSGVPSHGT